MNARQHCSLGRDERLSGGLKRKKWQEKLSELLARGDIPTSKAMALQHRYLVYIANGTVMLLHCSFLWALFVFNQYMFCCVFVWPLCT